MSSILTRKFWLERPKSDFWMWGFITLFLFRWVTPNVILMQVPFRIGLLGLNTTMDYNQITSKVATNLVDPMERLYNIGTYLNSNNPLLANILYYGSGYMIWVIWLGMILLILNLLRFAISYFYILYLKNKATIQPKHKDLRYNSSYTSNQKERK